MVTVSNKDAKKVIMALLKGEDYRIDFVELIYGRFFDYCITFFTKIMLKNDYLSSEASLSEISESDIDLDNLSWYKTLMLNSDLDKKDIAHNSGLNIKTIKNQFNTEKKKVVENASKDYFENIIKVIEKIRNNFGDLTASLNINLKDQSADFNLFEILIVINALGAKLLAIRGGAYSSIGQKIEKPLMLVLSELLHVPRENMLIKEKHKKTKNKRQIDFQYMTHKIVDGKVEDKIFNCEIKLMGSGNPESFDSALARYTNIFIANKISDKGKSEMNEKKVFWLETQNNRTLLNDFYMILKKLEIPCEYYDEDIPFLQKAIEILDRLLPNNN